MIDDEVRDALTGLVDEIGALVVRIFAGDEPVADGPSRVLALGGGEHLRVELPEGEPRADLDAALERAVRQLRAIRRRWEVSNLPPIAVTKTGLAPAERVHDRIVQYLRALAEIDRAGNAFVTRNGKLVASARDPSEPESSRWQFLARRVLGVHAPGSSHGEVVDPDAYAMTFWYDAALVVLLAEPYAVDFVRHRCRQVARELCNLLPMLDPDPEAPAAIRPRRPTQP
ncbi:MAG TPA: hypothetical protein VGL61_35265 [Kofleriaceae bacterium]|jgi:hypothetical protein